MVRMKYLRRYMARASKNSAVSLFGDAPAPGDEIADRILDAALEQFCLLGIRRSSMEDVARRADVGRVTIYRRFENKDRLVNVLMQREVKTAIAAVAAVHAEVADVESRWIDGFVTGMQMARGNRLLLALLSTEPEAILPLLTSKAGPGLALARTFIAHEIRRSRTELGLPTDDAEMIAEIMVRLVQSLVLTRETCLPIDDPDAGRAFAKRHLVPLVTLAYSKRR